MRILRPLRSPAVSLLWSGLSLSAIGDQLYAVALSWIAVQVLSENAGYLSALQAATVLIAALVIGRWADGWDHRSGMIGADLIRAAALFLLVAVWLVSGAPSAWTLTLAVIVLAIGQAIFQPALQSVLPELVQPRDLLPAANGLFDATDRSARLIGPGLIAVVAGSVPVVHFFTIDALSFAGSAAALLMIVRLRPAGGTEPRPKRQPFWQSITRGVTAMRAHPLLGFLLATTGLNNGAWYAVFYLGLPLMIADLGLGGSTGDGLSIYGLIISCYGCTNLASTIVFGSRSLPKRPQFQMFCGNCLVGTGIVLMGLTSFLPHPVMIPAIAAAAALGAIGGPMKDIPLAVLRQTCLDAADKPAAMRIYMAMNNAGLLLAMALAPAAIGGVGVEGFVVACGLIPIGIGLFGLARYWFWSEVRLPSMP